MVRAPSLVYVLSEYILIRCKSNLKCLVFTFRVKKVQIQGVRAVFVGCKLRATRWGPGPGKSVQVVGKSGGVSRVQVAQVARILLSVGRVASVHLAGQARLAVAASGRVRLAGWVRGVRGVGRRVGVMSWGAYQNGMGRVYKIRHRPPGCGRAGLRAVGVPPGSGFKKCWGVFVSGCLILPLKIRRAGFLLLVDA